MLSAAFLVKIHGIRCTGSFTTLTFCFLTSKEFFA